MLRFKILASVVPLIVAAVFARGEFSTGSRPCIAIGGASVQIASLPWQAQLQVSFTSDPSTATVRVQLSESAGAVDFAVVDDVDSAEDGACAANAATRAATSADPSVGGGRIRSAALTAGTSIRRSMRSISGPEMRA